MITLAALLAAGSTPLAEVGPRVCIEMPPVVIEDGPASTAPFCIDGADDPRCWLTPQPAVPAPIVSTSTFDLGQSRLFVAADPVWVVTELVWTVSDCERAGFPPAFERPPRASL